MLRGKFTRIAFVLASAIAIPTFAGGNVLVINDDDFDPPGNGAAWCSLLVANGYTRDVHPATGPVGSIDGYDVLIDLSSTWSDPTGMMWNPLRAFTQSCVVSRIYRRSKLVNAFRRPPTLPPSAPACMGTRFGSEFVTDPSPPLQANDLAPEACDPGPLPPALILFPKAS